MPIWVETLRLYWVFQAIDSIATLHSNNPETQLYKDFLDCEE